MAKAVPAELLPMALSFVTIATLCQHWASYSLYHSPVIVLYMCVFCRNEGGSHWSGNKRPPSLGSQGSQGSEDVFPSTSSSYPPPSMQQPIPTVRSNTFGRNQQPVTMSHIPSRADLPSNANNKTGPHNIVSTAGGGAGGMSSGLPPPDLTTGRSNYTDVQTFRQQQPVGFRDEMIYRYIAIS